MYENLLANAPTDLWIGGKWRKASDGGRFDVLDPATEDKIASVASATIEDAKAAVDALKAQRDEGQEQVAADEQRLAEGDKAPSSEPAEGEQSGTLVVEAEDGRHALAGASEGARKAGCDSFVTKPCLPDDLVVEVRRMLNAVKQG